MAEFPQFVWLDVNGQLVPSTKPQHYKKGSTTETELTGHDNPLPVAGYGMTESGVWIPRKVSNEGHDLTQVTGSNVEHKRVFDGVVGAGVEITVYEEAIPDDVVSIGFFVVSRNGRSFRMSLWESSLSSHTINSSFIYHKLTDKPSANEPNQITVIRYVDNLRLRIRNDDDQDGHFHARVAYYKAPVSEVF